MSQSSIIEEIVTERKVQDAQWGGPKHDDTHTAAEWLLILARHVGLAAQDAGRIDPVIWRRQMIRVAAVALASLESLERRKPGWVAGAHEAGSGY